jgi:hypothetical protein
VRNETKRNQQKRNETKRNQRNENEIKRKQNEIEDGRKNNRGLKEKTNINQTDWRKHVLHEGTSAFYSFTI